MLMRVRRAYRGLQGLQLVIMCSKSLEGIRRSYRRLQGVTRGCLGLEEDTGC